MSQPVQTGERGSSATSRGQSGLGRNSLILLLTPSKSNSDKGREQRHLGQLHKSVRYGLTPVTHNSGLCSWLPSTALLTRCKPLVDALSKCALRSKESSRLVSFNRGNPLTPPTLLCHRAHYLELSCHPR